MYSTDITYSTITYRYKDTEGYNVDRQGQTDRYVDIKVYIYIYIYIHTYISYTDRQIDLINA